eukprot:CAMPEP_0117035838 /NCGR_PEP_ID=MMETSP0472-20121206/25430_1 /TAXON_ID=693140 ORGANISM="Tiarina fusus, Strain LIS" /NCGR_SAMPLE_ID=MMETSP0472 /ASSEMBLY_ACC=CAM_ASM_000603 /LENGTH=203 /DNA_ID=CAMNT_0004745431 /DNA_START=188 /DNA_END=796 /DNA_ORIENTATION=-
MSGNGMNKAPPGSQDQSQSQLGEPDDVGSLPSQAQSLEFHTVASSAAPAFASMPQAPSTSMSTQRTVPFSRPDLASLYSPRHAVVSGPAASMPRPAAASMPRPVAASMPRPVATAQPTTAAAAPSSEEGQRRNPVVVERENFLMFIKILFKILEEAKEPETKTKAQRIVMECRRRSKQGDPNFNPMMEAVERRLRVFVGETKW